MIYQCSVCGKFFTKKDMLKEDNCLFCPECLGTEFITYNNNDITEILNGLQGESKRVC